MSVSDEKIYRLAEHLFDNIKSCAEGGDVKVYYDELKKIGSIRRLKQSEPSAIYRWVVVRKNGVTLVYEKSDNIPVLLHGDYLAMVYLVSDGYVEEIFVEEVLVDLEKPPESE